MRTLAFGAALSLGLCSTALPQTKGTYADSRDGRVYEIVKTGGQWWMAQNLGYLPHVAPGSQPTGIWVYGYEGSDVRAAKASANYRRLGCLYSWDSARSACPAGWHLPTKQDWERLLSGVGGEGETAFRQLVLGGASGFNSIPGGSRSSSINDQFKKDHFHGIGEIAYYWSSTEFDASRAWVLDVGKWPKTARLYENYDKRLLGLSVRCVKD